MKAADVMKKYDSENCKDFNIYGIINSLRKADDAEKTESQYNKSYEILAFCLVCNKELVDKADKDVILYWESRIETSNNPLLRLIYASLVWNFKQEITGQKRASRLYKCYVDTMLRVCDEDYCSPRVIIDKIFRHLLKITRNNEDFEKAKKNIRRIRNQTYQVL